MRTEIMHTPDEFLYKCRIIRISIKFTGEKERSFDISGCQGVVYFLPAFVVIVTGEDQIDNWLGRVHPDGSPKTILQAIGPSHWRMGIGTDNLTSCQRQN